MVTLFCKVDDQKDRKKKLERKQIADYNEGWLEVDLNCT